MTIEPGRELLHYRLSEKIGEGGMGVVWKATDTTLGREVAIKILPDTFAQDADRLARFEREAKLLAALNHPSIAAVYGLHEADGVRDVYASDWEHNARGGSTGRIYVHSGKTGERLHTLTGEAPGDGFGIRRACRRRVLSQLRNRPCGSGPVRTYDRRRAGRHPVGCRRDECERNRRRTGTIPDQCPLWS